MNGAQDIVFHWQRIIELRESIEVGNWLPQFAINQNNGVGSAVMAFYPYLTILPLVLLSFIIKSHLTFIFVVFILLTFITMLISFYSSLNVSKKISTSYLFALIYSLSLTHITLFFFNFDLGIILTLVFLPLIIFGFVKFINTAQWIELSIGMSLIIYSHVLNSIFVITLLIIWSFINYQKFDAHKCIQLFKAGVVTLLATASFWIPAIHLYLNNKIIKPFDFKLGGTTFQTLFNDALSNRLNAFLNVFDIIALVIIAILFYKRFNGIIKQMYWISIIFIIFCSPFLPWRLLQHSLGFIQFPWRLYIFPEILLDYIFAVGITKYIQSKQVKHILFYLSIVAVILLQFNSQNEIINQYKTKPDLLNKTSKISDGQQVFKLSDSKQFDNMLNVTTTRDYYLKKDKPFDNLLLNNQGLYDINHTLQFYHKNGYFTFSNNSGSNIQELNLPFLDYHGEHYDVYLDHHKVASHPNQNQILTINNVKPGNHTVKIVPIVTALTRASRIISIIGVLLYVFFALSKLFKKIKITRRKKKIEAIE